MRITIFGAGAMGTVYAARLALAGHDVAIVARGARRKTLEAEGLRIRRRGSSIVETARVAVLGAPDERVADVVIVLVRNQDLASVLPVLAQQPHDVAMMVNVANGYDAWTAALGSRLFVGFPGATGRFAQDGAVEYVITPGALQPTVLGEPHGPPSGRARALGQALREARFSVGLRGDMDAWQRTHAAWIAPFMLTAAAASDESAFATSASLRRCLEAMKEALAALRAEGVRPSPWAIRALGASPSTMVVAVMRAVLLASPSLRAHLLATGVASAAEGSALAADLIANARSRTGRELPRLDELRAAARGAGH